MAGDEFDDDGYGATGDDNDNNNATNKDVSDDGNGATGGETHTCCGEHGTKNKTSLQHVEASTRAHTACVRAWVGEDQAMFGYQPGRKGWP